MKLLAMLRNRKTTIAGAVLLAAALLIAGCGQKSAAESETSSPDTTETAAAAAAETEASESAEQKGSDTVETAAMETDAAEAAGTEAAESEGTETETPEIREEEPGASEADKADNADIENNGGYFVRRGDYIYFRVYGPDALPHTALWADFMQPVVGGASAIWRLDLKTNQYERLFDDSGWGGLWFFKDRLWLNRSTGFGDIVYCVDPDTFEKRDLAWGKIRGVSEDGSHLVYEGHTDDAAQAFYVTGDEEMDRVVFATEDEYLTYCGVVGRDLFFLSHNYESGKAHDELWQLDCAEDKDEAELILLGTFPDAEYGSAAEFAQFLADGDRIYVSVEYREGTGHFYAGSHYAAAVSGREGSMELIDDEAEKADVRILKARSEAEYERDFVQDPETLKMYIDETGKPAFAAHLAGDLELSCGEGTQDLVLYDGPEDILPSDGIMIFKGWLPEFEYADENDISCKAQVMEYVDGKVFTMYTESTRAPGEDIGWRYAYRLVRTDYEYFDPEDTAADTGALRHIDSVDAARWLDPEEIAELNKKIGYEYFGFFLSDYHDPTEIDWAEVFYNGAGIETKLNDLQRQEFLEMTGEEEIYTDITAVSGKDVRNYVRRMTGTSYDDAKHPLADSWDYMPKYDLYLFEHGDTNAQHIEFENGWDLGDNTYRLYYTVDAPARGYDSWPYAVTVRIENGQWIFISNLPE